ncbi:hypothetical protein [Ensifer sp. BR816]|uniref:hypothetical protein n=1 Tax=Rhizobium sp. (strain BR816) TaxID=1057002 RepID=UPI0012F71AD4|nr:hypothetical protein [Ensifer sp. BR816]
MVDFLSKRFGYSLYFCSFGKRLLCPDTTRSIKDKAGNRFFALQNIAAKQNIAARYASRGKPLDSFSAALEC